MGKQNLWFMIVWTVISFIMFGLVTMPRFLSFAIYAFKGLPIHRAKLMAKIRGATIFVHVIGVLIIHILGFV